MTSLRIPATGTGTDASPAASTRARRDSWRASIPAGAWWVLNVCLAVLFLYPLYILVTQATKSPAEASAAPPTLIPHSFTLENFSQLGTSYGGVTLLQSLGNSVFVSVLTTVITLVVTTLAGYAIAKLRFPGSQVFFFVTLITFMVPFQAIITPLFLTLNEIGLQNNLIGLSIVLATFNLPFGVFLMRNSFAAIPSSLEEAALIDGTSTLGALRHVLLPVAVPGIVSVALLTFFSAWNDFFATLTLITDQTKYTLPVALSILSSGSGTGSTFNWGLQEAGVAVTVIPCIIIYLILQRYYVAGLVNGAVK